MIRKTTLIAWVLAASLMLGVNFVEAVKWPEIDPPTVTAKLNEIMEAHVTYKKLNETIVKRALVNFIEELDPNKSYFIESDIHQWLNPPDTLVVQVLRNYGENKFPVFEEIHETMIRCIERRNALEKKVATAELPKKVDPKEFKDMKWTNTEEDLYNRLVRIKALQMEGTEKLSPDLREKALLRIVKRRTKLEEEILTSNAKEKLQLVLTYVLKSTASALDTHTAYFTPTEATQFMINVQQRLFGIGAQLRDDLNGFTVLKIVEGGPAANDKQLKVKDRIIAVNGEPVVGMDITDAVELIRGEEGTPVVLTVIREVITGGNKEDQKIDVTMKRGEVVLKETRLETSYEPFGDGVIAYLRLFSFYQDADTSSAGDMAKEIKRLKDEHKVKGIILDLRYNSGGMLSQAVAVTGLFITKGVVVSIKDDTGHLQHLRDLDSKTAWDGPLVVLTNRASASAAEIVPQTLLDYGRALIIGDDHTYGKGSFQTFTLTTNKKGTVNSQGEYKVTRGRYYTVSGKSPQLVGVPSDIVVPSALSEMEIGEKFAKYPLENDHIDPNFDDDLADIPPSKRDKIAQLYRFDLQPRLTAYTKYLDILRKNSTERIKVNKNYQNFLADIKNDDFEREEFEQFGQNDLQLTEAYNIMKDLILLLM